jgi:signal peptidase II
VIDQITKFAVLKYISTEDLIPVIPGFFNLVQVHNKGAAFGMLRDHPWIFLILASVALVVLAVITITRRVTEPLTRVAVAVLAAGVAGNLVDRLIHGHVIDFLDFILPWYGRWPAFNVADMCICVAAGLLIIASFLDGKKAKTASSLTT